VSENLDDLRAELPGAIKKITSALAPEGSDGQVLRVAERFALAEAAGKLAATYGIAPWQPGDVSAGILRCFQDWLKARGGVDAAEVRDGLARVRAFINLHGNSRFADVAGDPSKVINQAGWWKAEEGGRLYLISPPIFQGEVCAGMSARLVARALGDKGHLLRDGDRLQRKHRVPGHDKPQWFYTVQSSILEGDDGEA
jgi:putative DNA primase/helicase